MSWQEQALSFECRGHRLVGVLAAPAQPSGELGVVIVVGGPQYRAGSHRLFVKLARALAGAGIPALRFDVRGMGDSEGEFPGFEHLASDIAAAIDTLQRHHGAVARVALWGLCDAASAALLYLHETRDARVRHLCLLNPWVRSAQSLARTHVKHYYARRLLQRGFWLKLLGGRIGVKALCGLGANLRTALQHRHGPAAGAPAGFQQRMAQAWAGFDGELLLLLAGEDHTAREFLEHTRADAAWRAALRHPRLRQAQWAQADHTFSGHAASAWVLAQTVQWLQGPTPPCSTSASLSIPCASCAPAHS